MLLKVSFVFLFLLSACSTPRSTWDFLIYMDADNNLDVEMLKDMEEMQEGANSDDVRLLVQLDLRYGQTAKRYEIKNGIKTELDDIGEVDMTDRQTLTDFLIWAKSKTEKTADHTVLILSDHGNGWDQMVGPSPTDKLRSRSIFEDYDNGKRGVPAMHNHVVREAIEAANIELDILGLDASIMGTIEAIYEFSDLAEVIISSQEVGYASGWDYKDIFSRLSEKTGITNEAFSRMVVRSYKDFFEKRLYPSGQESFDQRFTIAAHRGSVINQVAIEAGDLAENLKVLLQNETSKLDTIELVKKARQDVQVIDKYIQPFVYVDLKNLVEKMGVQSNIPDLIDQATIVSYSGKDRVDANGLSIVFYKFTSDPDDIDAFGLTYDKNYKNWDADTETGNKGRFINEFQWDEMMRVYNSLAYPDLEL